MQIDRLRERNKLFVETEAFHEAKQILEDRGFVTIIGTPGSGKSSVALQLVLEFNETHEYCQLDRIQEWESKINLGSRYIVLLDDLFGATYYDKNRKEGFEYEIRNETFMEMIHHRNVLFIFTSRKSIYKEAEQFLNEKAKAIFLSFLRVDLCDEYKLSVEEKESILRIYANEYTESGRNKKTLIRSVGKLDRFIDEVARIESPIGFPQCVNEFFKDSDILRLGLEFFKCPMKYICSKLDELFNNDKVMYSFLVLLALLNEEHKILERDICNEMKNGVHSNILREIDDHGIQNINEATIETHLLQKYNGTYLKRYTEDDIVGLQHISYLDSICYSYSMKFPTNALARLPYDLSIVKFGLSTSRRLISGYHILLRQNNHEDFTSRLCKELSMGNLQDVCKHPLCSDIVIGDRIVRNIMDKDPSILQLTERDLDVRELFNGSLLYWSAYFGAVGLCKAILERGNLHQIKDKFWLHTQASAALVCACKEGFGIQIIKMLCLMGADPLCRVNISHNYTNIEWCDFCHIQCCTNCLPVDAQGESVDEERLTSIGLDGSRAEPLSPFHAVVLSKSSKVDDQVAMFKELSNFIPDQNMEKKRIVFANVLGYAIRKLRDKDNVVDYILDNDCSADTKNDNGLTPLWYAVQVDNSKHARILIQKGASVNTTDDSEEGKGQSLLMIAKGVKLAELLLQQDPNLLQYVDRDNQGPLHMVQCPEVAKLLLEKGVNVNNKNNNGDTPLHTLQIFTKEAQKILSNAEANDIAKEIADTLLYNGADVSITNNEGKTPLDVAKHSSIAISIIDHMNYGPAELSLKLTMSTNIHLIQKLLKLGGKPDFVLDITESDTYNDRSQPYHLAQSLEKLLHIDDKCSTYVSTALSSSSSDNGFRAYSPVEYSQEAYQYFDLNNYADIVVPLTPILLHAKRGTISEQMLTLIEENIGRIGPSMISSPPVVPTESQETRHGYLENILHHILSPEKTIANVMDVLGKILNVMSRDEINSKNEKGNTPLHLACSRFKVNKLRPRIRQEVVEKLLCHGADSAILNQKGEYPAHRLFYGKCRNISKLLEELLDNRNINIDHESEQGLTLLRMVCNKQTVSPIDADEGLRCVNVLLDHDPPAKCYPQDLNSYLSPILLARQNNIEIFSLLLHRSEHADKSELMQIIDSCIVEPENVLSWKTMRRILNSASDGKFKIKPGCFPDETNKKVPYCCSPEVVVTEEDIEMSIETTKSDRELVSMMICDGEPVNNEKLLEKYMLHYLISCIQCNITNKFNADVNFRDSTGKTILMKIFYSRKMKMNIKQAAEAKSGFPVKNHVLIDAIKFLMTKNVDVNAKDDTGVSVLQHCIKCERGDEFVSAALDVLLENGANANHGTPLFWAIDSKYPRYKVLEILMKDRNVDKTQIYDGKTVVFAYVKKLVDLYKKRIISGDLRDGERTIKLFSKMGLDMDAVPETRAVECGGIPRENGSQAKILYSRRNTQATAMETQNETALQYAVKCFTLYDSAHVLYKSRFVHALLDSNASVNVRDNNGRTVLHQAVMQNNYRERDLLRLLVHHGGDINAVDNNGCSVLHCAISRMNHDTLLTVLFILSHDIEINRQNLNGNTVLHTIVKHSQPNVSQIDRSHDHFRCSPLRTSVLRYLLNHGADVNVTNNDGQTPLDILVNKYNEFRDKECEPRHMVVDMISAIISFELTDKTKLSAIQAAKYLSLEQLVLFLEGNIPAEDLCRRKTNM